MFITLLSTLQFHNSFAPNLFPAACIGICTAIFKTEVFDKQSESNPVTRDVYRLGYSFMLTLAGAGAVILGGIVTVATGIKRVMHRFPQKVEGGHSYQVQTSFSGTRY